MRIRVLGVFQGKRVATIADLGGIGGLAACLAVAELLSELLMMTLQPSAAECQRWS